MQRLFKRGLEYITTIGLVAGLTSCAGQPQIPVPEKPKNCDVYLHQEHPNRTLTFYQNGISNGQGVGNVLVIVQNPDGVFGHDTTMIFQDKNMDGKVDAFSSENGNDAYIPKERITPEYNKTYNSTIIGMLENQRIAIR